MTDQNNIRETKIRCSAKHRWANVIAKWYTTKILEVVLYGIKQSGKLNHTRILNNASSSSLTLREFSEIFWKMDVMYYLIQGTSFVLHIFVLFYSQVKNIDMPLAIVSFCFYINSFVTGKKPQNIKDIVSLKWNTFKKIFF